VRIGLITHTTGGRGGIERVVELQAAGLRARGHTVDLVTGPELGSGWIARAVAAAGLAFRRGRALRRFDVLLAHYQPSPWLAQRSGVPTVHYFHMPVRALHPTTQQRTNPGYRAWAVLCRRLERIDRSSVAAAAEVAFPSPSVGRDLVGIYGRGGTLLPLGVDTSVFAPEPGQPGEHLLFAGRLGAPYKHLDWAIEVARRLGRPLHVVGEGTRPAVPDDAEVVFRGYLEGEKLAAAYRDAAVLLFPSAQEDFGLVPLEAMASGLPVVGWDDGHGPSLTLAVGSGGRLVAPYDLDAYTAAVEELLGDGAERERLAAAGPAWVRDRFSLDRHLDGLEQLLARATA
jgi:glycosyltransferase involved in cell wall biosynthesis